MPKLVDITSPPDDIDELLEAAMPELEALDASRLVRRSVLRRTAVNLTQTLLTSWEPLKDWIDEELSPARAEQRKAELERLDRRAWTFYAADLAAEQYQSNTSRKKRIALAKKVREHDRFLFKWAVAFFGDDPDDARTLREISAGTGRRDDAEDVVRLAALYRLDLTRWNEVKDGDKTLNMAYIKEAAADAAHQLDLLRNGDANPARILADAAYALWYYDYDELMQLGRYLTRRQPDSLERFPGIREPSTVLVDSDGDGEIDDEVELDEAETDEVEAEPEVEDEPEVEETP